MKALLLALIFVSANAQAAITIDCGHGLKNGKLEQRYFLITAPSHRLEGEAGKTWHLYDYLGGEVLNASMSMASNGNLLLFIQNGFLGLPGVGTEYEIEKPWGGSPLKAIGRVKGGSDDGRAFDQLDCLATDH